MDGNGMGRKHRAALRRTMALLLAMADLAERACDRSRPVRWLVLLILGAGEAVAQDYVARLTGVPASDLTTRMPIDQDDRVADAKNMDDGVARAMRLAFVFRALSAALAALPEDEAAAPAARISGLAAAFRDPMAALPVECRDSS